MAEPIRFRDIRLEGGYIIIRPEREDLGKAMALIRGIKKKLYTLTVKEHRNKRSLDANQKMWARINEMSTMIKLTPEEINEFAADWCNGHIGRMVEDMGPCRKRDLRGYHNLRCYKGSSEYDTQTFSRLLELVMQDCRQLGIETMSERERSLLMEEWEATYADRHQGTVYTKGS